MILVRGLILIGIDEETGEQIRIETPEARVRLDVDRPGEPDPRGYRPAPATTYRFVIEPDETFNIVMHHAKGMDAEVISAKANRLGNRLSGGAF